MSAHTCEAVVVHCIDFRLQHFLNDWLTKRFGKGNYDRISWAGGVREFAIIQGQIETSRQLHQVKKAILINHEDCGAYGEMGTKERHVSDLRYAEHAIKSLYLDVEKYYLHLNGEFEKIE
ncbi:MAG TPA: carbonic anhydrase [Anaerolineales bacterium]|nr:carbonic anhydrase [Anaerolineales bacterium]